MPTTKTDEALAHGTANGELAGVATGEEFLPAERCRQLHRIMLQARAMEERMIKMSKSGEGYFWIGGPGEEAFNAALGLQVKKGQGPDYDYLHLHYRNSATLVAMGLPVLDCIRQMVFVRRQEGAALRVVVHLAQVQEQHSPRDAELRGDELGGAGGGEARHAVVDDEPEVAFHGLVDGTAGEGRDDLAGGGVLHDD